MVVAFMGIDPLGIGWIDIGKGRLLMATIHGTRTATAAPSLRKHGGPQSSDPFRAGPETLANSLTDRGVIGPCPMSRLSFLLGFPPGEFQLRDRWPGAIRFG
jgi:hypothetical protein